jgi:hypothetical protein
MHFRKYEDAKSVFEASRSSLDKKWMHTIEIEEVRE